MPTINDKLAGNVSLEEHDPEMFDLIEREKNRQWKGLELIASENFTSRAVMECLGSCLTNKYAEGLPGKRYYGGSEIVDKVETLCQDRALKAYGLDPEQWGVNVQPYSGSPANFAVYTGVLQPHDRIMGLDLPSGGHLTHGFYSWNPKTQKKKVISATSLFFESLPYRVSAETGGVDFDELEKLAALFKPNMLIMGGSAYPRDWEYEKFRAIADSCGALLMMDMAHISGLIAVGEHKSPFEFCDIVTSTTHKSLRGARSGFIFMKKDERGLQTKIDQAVFPALQGGPHMHQIAGVATQLKEVMTPEFKQYIVQVKANAKTLAKSLTDKGYKLATDGTDNHLLLWDLRPSDITGSKMEKLCDKCHITLNKNAVLGDRSALSPGGVRIGTPALTTRGFVEADFEAVGDFLHRAVELCKKLQEKHGKQLAAFVPALDEDEDVKQLCIDVKNYGSKFPMPGYDVTKMKFQEL
jgi:glycine hydroxymethyltransferase